ncbi:hypothetical protein P7C73_g1703, partial [Tremellales sp. Uapishka_1]
MSSSSVPGQASEQAPLGGTKRRRTAQACAPCRSKKCKVRPSRLASNGEAATHDFYSATVFALPAVLVLSWDIPVLTHLNPRASQAIMQADRAILSPRYIEMLEARLNRLESQSQSNHRPEPISRMSVGEGGWLDNQVSSERTVNYASDVDVADDQGELPWLPSSSSMNVNVRPVLSLPQRPRRSESLNEGGTLNWKETHSPPLLPVTAPTATLGVGTPQLEFDTPQGKAPPGSIDGMGLLPSISGRESLSTRKAPSSQPPQVRWQDVSSSASGFSPDQEFYGDTSGVSFHTLLLDTLLPGYGCLAASEVPLMTSTPEADQDQPTGFLGLTIGSGEQFFVRPEGLPTATEAKAMWEYFSNHTLRLYPFVVISALEKSYLDLLSMVEIRKRPRTTSASATGWASSRGQDILKLAANQPLLALQFLVFALAQAVSLRPIVGKDVHLTALSLLRKHVDWPHSMVKTQALLIGTMLMQGVDCPTYSWDLLGYAVRSAYAIGLHDPKTSRSLGALEAEVRLRVWWGCFIFDRFLTVIIGRPSSVTTGTSNLSLPSVLPGEHPTAIRFLTETVRLYCALSGLVTDPPTLASTRSATTDSIQAAGSATYKLERDYALWSDSVCPELQCSPSGYVDPLAIVLGLRGATMRLLLHRPIVLAAIRDRFGLQSRAPSPTRGVSRSLVHALDAQQRNLAFGTSLAAVIETAIMTVWLLEKGASGSGNLSAPWYQLFYAMNAFMTIVATFLLDLTQWGSMIKTPAEDMVQSLYKVKHLVTGISAQYNRASAKRALLIIEQLLQALSFPTLPSGRPTQNGPAPEEIQQFPLHTDVEQGNGDSLISETGLSGFPHLDFEELWNTLRDTVPDEIGSFGGANQANGEVSW